MGGYEKLQNTEKSPFLAVQVKNNFWNIFFSGCDSMDVGRSGEVQGVVGRVWVVEITCLFDGYSIFLKKYEI